MSLVDIEKQETNAIPEVGEEIEDEEPAEVGAKHNEEFVENDTEMPWMNPFELLNLKNEVNSNIAEQNIGKSNLLVVEELDIFLKMRIEKDDPTDLYEIFNKPAELQQISNEMNVDGTPNAFEMDMPDMTPGMGGPDMFDQTSLQSQGEYSFENGFQSQGLREGESTPHIPYTPDNKYELDSNAASFISGGDGIFRESSFMLTDTENSVSNVMTEISLK